jgi:hypothetical protein
VTVPSDERLTYRYTNEEDGKVLRRYWTTACPECPLKSQCTKGPERRITRWEHEHVLDAVQQRLDANRSATSFASWHNRWTQILNSKKF